MTQHTQKRTESAPLVSIILLNWNQFEVTSACLDSLLKLTYPAFEVLVVDQASRNQESERLSAAFPSFKHIKSATNVGFTGGNNLAMQHARGEFVVLLNNDTEVQPGFLKPLVDAFEANPVLGVASPKIEYFDAPGVIQYAGCEGINLLTMRGTVRGHKERDRGQYEHQIPVQLAHGAAMMIRRSVLEQVGLLAPDFFIYYEEFDFCSRARGAGWDIHYVPGSAVKHKESVTVGKNSPIKTHYMMRNRLLFLRRNSSGLTKAVGLGYVVFFAFPAGLLKHTIRQEWKHAKAILSGLFWHAKKRDIRRNQALEVATSEVIA